jgi:hypothetical protein
VATFVAVPFVVSNRGLCLSSIHENFVATVAFFDAARLNTASGWTDGSSIEMRSPRSIAS